MYHSPLVKVLDHPHTVRGLLAGCALIFAGALILNPLSWATLLCALILGTICGLYLARASLTKLLSPSSPPRPLADLHREQTEARTTLQQYTSLVDNLAAAVVIRNEAGKIVYCSPYTEVLTGYARSEMESHTGDFFLQIVHEEDRDKLQRALQINISGEPFQFRCRYFHKSGIEMWYETRTVPVHSKEGTFLFSLSITIDVTATVRSQKQLEERNKDLQDFTYMVSHDLKAPIFTLKGMVGVIKEDLGSTLPADAVETFQHIDRAAQRLEQLVGSILEYSRVSIQETKSEEVELSEVLNDVLNDFTVQRESCNAAIEIAPGLPRVTGERIKVYQIFSNLIGNALKYRDAARPLRIEISEKPQRFSRVTLISVKDNGAGIAPEKVPALFRPFQRGATHVEGLGIGLACVQKLVDKLGGKVEVQSELGAGTEFLITLRRAAPSLSTLRER